MSERPRFRRLRRVALTVLVALVVLVLALAWLLATPSGARFALARAQGFVPGALSIGRVDGTLLGTLEITGLDYEYGDTRVAVGRLAVQVAPSVLLNFRRLTVRQLRLEGVTVRYPAPEPAPSTASAAPAPPVVPEVAMSALPLTIEVERFEAADIAVGPAGREPQRIDRVALAGRLAGTSLDVASLEVDAPAGRVALSGRADLAARLALDVDVRWALTGAQGAAGRLEVAGDRASYRMQHELAAPFEATSAGTVELPVNDEPRVRLRHDAARIVAGISGRVLEFDDIELDTVGRYTDWRVEGRAGVSDPTVGTSAVALSATGSGGDLVLESFEAAPEKGGSLAVTGAIGGWPNAEWRARIDTRDAPLALAGVDVDATVDAGVNAKGALGAAPFVEATIESLAGRWREGTLDAAGALAWRPGAVTFDAVQVSVGANRASIDGRVATNADADADLAFELDAPELAVILPELAGRLTASGRVVGPARAPAIDTRFELSAFSGAGVTLASASGSLDVLAGDLQFALNARASGLAAGAVLVDALELTANGTPGAHSLVLAAQSARVPAAGLTAAGGVAGGRWLGRVTALDATLQLAAGARDFALVDPFDVELAADEQRIGRACLAAEPTPGVCVQAALDPERVDLQASVTGLSVEAWAAGAPFGLEWVGDAAASVALQGPRERLSGRASLNVDGLAATREGEAGTTTIAFDEASAAAILDAGVLDASARLAVAGGGVAEAAIGFGDVYAGDGALEGRVGLSIPDVTAVNALVDSVRFSAGEFRAEATLDGTRDAPVITSRVDAGDLRARLLPLGIEIADVQIEANNENSDVLRFSGSGRSGEGRFELRGETALEEGAAFATRATVRAEQFTFLDLPDQQAVASMDLALAADRERQSLTGELTVDRADLRVQTLPESAVRVSPDAVRVDDTNGDAEAERARRIERSMDVRVGLSDAVRFDAFGLRGRLEGALDLRKRAAAPLQGFGALDVRDGIYKAYGQSLEVTRGRLVFNGPLDAPVLDVRAERQVAEKRVGIQIEGTPDALESSLFSEPRLPEAEAFSLLITGRSLASAGQAGDTPLGDIALALGLREAFAVGSAVRDAVGLDTLTLEGGGSDGRVLAGKQISPQLYLEYAYGVFDQVSSVLLRLQINDRLALESTSGQAQSVDLVYSVGAR